MTEADGLWSTLTDAIFFNTGYSNVESHNRKFYKNQTFSNFHTTVTFYFVLFWGFVCLFVLKFYCSIVALLCWFLLLLLLLSRFSRVQLCATP